MKIIEKNDVASLESYLKASSIVSELMDDFPPIFHEDHPEMLAQYISQYFLHTGEVISWEQIPDHPNEPLKAIRRKRKAVIE
jgi:hypothetical protein